LASQINASNSGFGGIVSTGDSSGVLQLQAAGTTIATIQSTGLNLSSNGLVFSDSSTQTAAASPYVLKNRIINGDMRIDQRNAGASVTPTGSTYTLDRWGVIMTQASKFSVQQNAASVTPPAGFINYLGITSSSSYSVLTGDTFLLYQNIEGLNVADLEWGTASAQTVTLSFWVRSSLTGTFGGVLSNSAGTRSYPFTYTITAANTWEKETITIAGDTTGTWLTTNGIGIKVRFGLGSGATYSGTAGAWAAGDYVQPTGSVSVVGTNGATFYITGVQLEIGSSATPFERRLYDKELISCQRYYTFLGGASYSGIASGMQPTTVRAIFSTIFPVALRAAPTITFSNLIATDRTAYDSTITALLSSEVSTNGAYTNFTMNAAGVGGYGIILAVANGTTGKLMFSAEL
jgi:hypothetical protein